MTNSPRTKSDYSLLNDADNRQDPGRTGENRMDNQMQPNQSQQSQPNEVNNGNSDDTSQSNIVAPLLPKLTEKIDIPGAITSLKFYYNNANKKYPFLIFLSGDGSSKAEKNNEVVKAEKKIVSIDSVYDLFNYSGELGHFVLFCLVVFIQSFLLSQIKYGNPFDDDRLSPNSRSGQLAATTISLCMMVYIIFSLGNLSWTTKKMWFAMLSLDSAGFCTDDLTPNMFFRCVLVCIVDLTLWFITTYKTARLVLNSQDVTAAIVNLLSIGFILQLDEVCAQLMHVKVVLVNNIEKDTVGGLKMRRTNRRWGIVVAIAFSTIMVASMIVLIVTRKLKI